MTLNEIRAEMGTTAISEDQLIDAGTMQSNGFFLVPSFISTF